MKYLGNEVCRYKYKDMVLLKKKLFELYNNLEKRNYKRRQIKQINKDPSNQQINTTNTQ